MTRRDGGSAENRKEASRSQTLAVHFRVSSHGGESGLSGQFLCKAQAGLGHRVP